jgi:hypothetical protein
VDPQGVPGSAQPQAQQQMQQPGQAHAPQFLPQAMPQFAGGAMPGGEPSLDLSYGRLHPLWWSLTHLC